MQSGFAEFGIRAMVERLFGGPVSRNADAERSILEEGQRIIEPILLMLRLRRREWMRPGPRSLLDDLARATYPGFEALAAARKIAAATFDEWRDAFTANLRDLFPGLADLFRMEPQETRTAAEQLLSRITNAESTLVRGVARVLHRDVLSRLAILRTSGSRGEISEERLVIEVVAGALSIA